MKAGKKQDDVIGLKTSSLHWKQILIFLVLGAGMNRPVDALSLTNKPRKDLARKVSPDVPSNDDSYVYSANRRRLFQEVEVATLSTLSAVGLEFVSPGQTNAAIPFSDSGLAARLAKRDPSALKNRIFNIPPAAQVYPSWIAKGGEWEITSKFAGYLFPSTKISRERITKNFGVAGFQKCSIAATADVGKESVTYRWKVDPNTGLEDRNANLSNSINAYLGYTAVKTVLYDAKANPNRISIDFVDYKTVNAERIELFCNARESEEFQRDESTRAFVCAEYARQVTFGTGSTQGVPRQVSTNYANYWTWIWPQESDTNKSEPPMALRGNLLTAAYLDPQDAMYFEEPQNPVAIYSHSFTAKRVV